MASALLAPLAGAYGAIADRRLARSGANPGRPVVCIGNLTLGGAGKTPLALAVAALLAEANERPFCLSRGYGGRLDGPLQVDPIVHGFEAVGDEPLLLARAFPTVVARDRLAGARLAVERGASVIVMDDGFQNPSVAKNSSLLVIDATQSVGNGRVFPAGPLRAGLERQLSRANALVVVGDGPGSGVAAAMAKRHRLPIFTGRIVPDAAAMAELRGRAVLAFAGIGIPEKFFAMLRGSGVETKQTRAFADHHPYTAADAEELVRTAERDGLTLVTTEKDLVRLRPHADLSRRTRAVPVMLELDDPRPLADLLLSGIRKGA